MAAKESMARKAAVKPSRKAFKRTRATRRLGGETSKTRSDLLDAAEELMRTEGYAAVTSRKVASQAKITPQLVHYYFRTMDDLFLALWRRFVTNNVERQARTRESREPLRALWDFSINTADTALESEFMALTHHRKAIRKEIAEDGARFRQLQVDALQDAMRHYDFGDDTCTSETLAVVLTSIARSLVMEKSLGLSMGHEDTFRSVEGWIDRLEAQAARARRSKTSKGRATRPAI